MSFRFFSPSEQKSPVLAELVSTIDVCFLEQELESPEA